MTDHNPKEWHGLECPTCGHRRTWECESQEQLLFHAMHAGWRDLEREHDELRAEAEGLRQQLASWQGKFGEVVSAKSEIVKERDEARREAIALYDRMRAMGPSADRAYIEQWRKELGE